MSADARRHGVSCTRGRGARLTLIALTYGALAASGSQAFALKIPIQASLSGAGEVPPNDSPGRCRMTGVFDTDSNTLEWTVTYSGLSGPAIAAHFHGPTGPRISPSRNFLVSYSYYDASQPNRRLPMLGSPETQPISM